MRGVRKNGVEYWREILGRGLVEPSCEAADFRGRTAGQAEKCTGWMPRHEPAMKDVASCEKPRGAASKR